MRTHPSLKGIGGLAGGVLIGRGGFSVIYRATQTRFGRTVAVKLITDGLENDRSRTQFTTECRAFGALGGHPHVLTVHDAGVAAGGAAYLILEHCARGSVAQRIARAGRRPAAEVRTILNQTAQGLTAAHAAGVLHRDVKPGNILIDEFGRCRLSDFGIASVRRVATGQRAWTPGFAAPEIVAGGPASEASDIYALAITACVAAGAELEPETSHAGVWSEPAHETADPPSPEAVAVTRNGTAVIDPRAATALRLVSAIDPALAAILEPCLSVEPSARPAVAELSAMISDCDPSLPMLTGEPFSGLAASEETLEAAFEERCPYRGLAPYDIDDGAVFFGREASVAAAAKLLESHRLVAIVGASGSGKSSLVRAGLVNHLSLASHVTTTIVVPSASPAEQLPKADVVDDRSSQQLVVVDQLERVFSVASRPDRKRFFDRLLALTRHPAWRVVVVVRSDALDRCAEHAVLARRMAEAQLVLEPMGPHELTEAIQAPADQHGLTLDPQLVGDLVDAGMKQSGALPLVSQALAETWKLRHRYELTLANFREAGGLEGVVAVSAEQALEEVDEAGLVTVRRPLRRLAAPQNKGFTRRTASIDDLGWLTTHDLSDVMELLTKARLIVVDGSTVEVAHEALFDVCPTIRAWLVADRELIGTIDELCEASERWQRLDRPSSELWRGARLDRAVEITGPRRDDLTKREIEFLGAAQAQRVAAESDAARREAHLRSTNRRLRNLLAIAAVAIIAATATGLAFIVQRGTVESESTRADAATRRSVAQTLRNGSGNVLGSDPELAGLLAAQAEAIDPGLRNGEALIRVLDEGFPVDSVLLASVENIRPAGAYVVLGDGSVVLDPAEDGGSMRWWNGITAVDGPVGRLISADARDGSVLIDTGTEVRIWNPGADVEAVIAPGSAVHAAWSDADARVSLLRDDGTLEVRDLAIGAVSEPRTFSEAVGDPSDLPIEIVRGQAWTAIWNGWGVTIIRDDGDLFPERVDFDVSTFGESAAMAVAPSGSLLAVAPSGSSSVTLVRFDVLTTVPVTREIPRDPDVEGLEFVDDDRLAGWDAVAGELFVFDLRADSRLTTDRPVKIRSFDGDTDRSDTLPDTSNELASISISDSGDIRVMLAPVRSTDFSWLMTWRIPYSRIPAARLNVRSGGTATDTAGDRRLSGVPGGVEVFPGGLLLERLAPEIVGPFFNTPFVLHEPTIPILIDPEAVGPWSAEVAYAIDLNSTGTTAAAAFPDGHVEVWDVDSGESRFSYEAQSESTEHQPVVTSVAVSPDGTVLAVADSDIRTFIIGFEEPSRQVRGANDTSGQLAFTSDGRRLITTIDHTLRIIDLDSDGPIIPIFLAGVSPATDEYVIALTHDERGVFVGGVGEQGSHIQLFDVETGEEIDGPLRGHTGEVTALSTAPDGSYLVSAATDGTVRIWPLDADGRNTRPTFELTRGEATRIWDLDVTPENVLLIGRSNLEREAIDMDIGRWTEAVCRRASRALSSAEWERWGSPDIPFEPACP